MAIGSLHPDGARVSILLADHVSTSRAAVHELDLATGATTPLLTLPEDEWVGYVVWLPSGQEYVMSVYRPSTQMTELRRFSRSSPTSTGTPIPGTQCANLADPTVSPDGRQIVFLCGNTYRSVGLDGARPAPLPPGFRSLGPVKFSPDGEFLAYTSYEDSQIWFLRLSTGEHWRAFDTDDIALLSDWR
ncbi:MAG: PD40 domain-containing protein [Gemmatimonadales bacterium]|nr:PD40 domain-containing protein [Gemmatimonadales bacterium]